MCLELPARETEEEVIYSQTPVLPLIKGSFICASMAEWAPKHIPHGNRREVWQREPCYSSDRVLRAIVSYSLLWQQLWNQKVSQKDVRGDLNNVQHGLKVLDPIPMCTCWGGENTASHTTKQLSGTQLGVLQFNSI